MCFILLGAKSGEMAVFKKNITVLLNIERLDIKKTGEYPLKKSGADGRIIYVKAADVSQINTDEILVEYSLEKEDFTEKHAGLVEHPCWEAHLPGLVA